MNRYGQSCPIAIAAEAFAGGTRFSQLERRLPRMPKFVLAQ